LTSHGQNGLCLPLELIPAIGKFEHIAGFHATPVEGTGVMRETANIDAND